MTREVADMAVRVEARLQYATVDPILDLLLACLQDTHYRRFRFMVAFARWSGLFLLDTDLQTFAHRKGTSIEGLTYLSELPSAHINIIQANTRGVVFHPKVFEFSGDSGWLTVIGSS